MRRIVFALLLLGACEQAPDIGVVQVQPLRDVTAPIASQVNVTPAQMAGDWHVVAAFSSAPAGPRTGQALTVQAAPGGDLRLSSADVACSDTTNLCESTSFTSTLETLGQGRWGAAGGVGWLPSGPLWVLWMDADARTAVIGRPDGLAAWVMDRNSAGSPDRLTAGRDILDWFGYDMARLEEVSR